MRVCNGVSGMHSSSSSVSAWTHNPYIHHTTDTKIRHRTVLKLNKSSLQLFSIILMLPFLRATEKIKHSQNWIFHHRSCHVMRSKHLALGAAWIQTIRKNWISTSKWATTHIQSLSCTHLPQFGVLSWGASTTATVKVTSKVKLQQVVLGQHLLPTHSVGSQYSKLHTIQVHAAGTVVVHYWVSSCGPCFLNRHESLLAFTFIHSCADCIYIKFLKCHCVPASWSFSHCLTD